MRRILKLALGLFLLNAVVWAVGQAMTRSKTSSDLSADEVEFYTFWNGAEYVPRSQSLRRVKARTLMGGATVDLRQATPAEAGLAVDVGTLLGGVAVLVPKDWDIEVIEDTESASVEIALEEGAELPAEGPQVTVRLRTRFGGALVGYELPAQYAT